jgi:hypothetical protein
MAGTMFTRADAADPWVGTVLEKNQLIAIPEIGIELPMAALHADVEFPSPTTAELEEGWKLSLIGTPVPSARVRV